jgi:hypothetical protein
MMFVDSFPRTFFPIRVSCYACASNSTPVACSFYLHLTLTSFLPTVVIMEWNRILDNLSKLVKAETLISLFLPQYQKIKNENVRNSTGLFKWITQKSSTNASRYLCMYVCMYVYIHTFYLVVCM